MDLFSSLAVRLKCFQTNEWGSSQGGLALHLLLQTLHFLSNSSRTFLLPLQGSRAEAWQLPESEAKTYWSPPGGRLSVGEVLKMQFYFSSQSCSLNCGETKSRSSLLFITSPEPKLRLAPNLCRCTDVRRMIKRRWWARLWCTEVRRSLRMELQQPELMFIIAL